MSGRLAKVLFNYRIVPQTTTSTSPAKLLLGWRPRTRQDLLRPVAAERVEEKQKQQNDRHDRRAKPRTFRVGDAAFMKNFRAGRRWFPGQIVKMCRFVYCWRTGDIRGAIKTIYGRERWMSETR
jgi:hypothetical protein